MSEKVELDSKNLSENLLNDADDVLNCGLDTSDEDFNFEENNRVEEYFVTDTDFIPPYIKEGDDAALVYGILQYYNFYRDGKIEYIYNLICRLCKRQQTLILKRIRVKQWIKLLDNITNKLGAFQNKQGYDIYFYLEVPFCDIFYGFTDVLLQSYEFAHSLLTELLNSDFKDIELIEFDNDSCHIKSLRELFLDFRDEIEEGCLDYTDMSTFESEMVYDEMLRRGLIMPTDKILKDYDYPIENENRYRKYLLGGKLNRPITIETDNTNSVDEIMVKGVALKVVGTLYYMLKDHVKDVNIIARVASYVLLENWIEKKNGKLTAAYQYIHSPKRFLSNDAPDYIVDNLLKYECNIPKVLQDYVKKPTITKEGEY